MPSRAAVTTSTRDPSVDSQALEAQRLAAELQNLHSGPLVVPELVALGEAAIPAVEATLRGRSQALHHPRSLAADVLGAIGGEKATAALIRALEDSTGRTLDPAFREAEAVVVRHIATHLRQRPTPFAIDAVLDAMRVRPNAACAELLGEHGNPQAIPPLLSALREDAVREAAMNALRRFGRVSVLRLRAALAMPHYVGGIEPPTSIDARAAVAALLGELGERTPLILALDDRTRSVRLAAATALASSPGGPPRRALEVLIDGLDDPNWAHARSIMDVLAPLSSEIVPLLQECLDGPVGDEASERRHRRVAVLAGRLGLGFAGPLLAALCAANDQELRLAAVQALGNLSTASESELAGFLADPALIVAAEAFQALRARGRFNLRDIAPYLKRSSSYRRAWNRWRRLWALRKTLRG